MRQTAVMASQMRTISSTMIHTRQPAIYLSINNSSATRTLFRWLYLAHLGSFFLLFFAVFSDLTPGIQQAASNDRGAVP